MTEMNFEPCLKVFGSVPGKGGRGHIETESAVSTEGQEYRDRRVQACSEWLSRWEREGVKYEAKEGLA